MSFFKKIFTVDYLKPLWPTVEKINTLEEEWSKKNREELVSMTRNWQNDLLNLFNTLPPQTQQDKRALKAAIDGYLNNIIAEAFASVRVAAQRTLGQRHFDVQLLGGLVLHYGNIAEMKTGEGKTLAATAPVYLNALSGRGVHVITVNDYLARRDASWMGRVYDYLGLSVGVIQHDRAFRYQAENENLTDEAKSASSSSNSSEATAVELDVKNLVPCSRAEAYACDITYGTNNEYGFDYLRDNMVLDYHDKVQRQLYYAIVDEVDSILIDEARTPLIISAPDTAPTDQYYEFAKLVENLTPQEDFKVDEKKKSATLTEAGIAKLEKLLKIDNIYVERGVATVHHIEQALRARTLFKRDKDYVVKGNEVIIVDEFTGRLLPGRRYSEGLHQAIEAKEGVTVERESKTMATITFQNYFRLYAKLAGMTGTAMTEAEEFEKIYGLTPVEIPTHRPMIRKDYEDAVFKTQSGKYQALVREVKSRFSLGQPVLIGTVSIEKNEQLSNILKSAGIPHQVLNAKNHEQEAKIIAQAGRFKAVTLATNIAGRGVDIILGGNPYNQQEADKVRAIGGLHVIGTERHESRRIDNQLRGRAGRQGDPGSTQFFVSLEDDLIRVFGGDRVQKMMAILGVPDDMPIEHGLVSKVIEQAQKKIEGLNFDLRKHVLEYDDVMNRQRDVIYRIRDRALQPDANLKEEILNKIIAEIEHNIVQPNLVNHEGLEKLVENLSKIFVIPPDKVDELKAVQQTGSAAAAIKLAKEMYEAKEQSLTSPVMRAVERAVTLRAIDSLWVDHLDTMEHLREGVRLRGYAQRDPLIEYKREGFDLFQRLLAEIDKQIVYTIYKIELSVGPQMVANNSALARQSNVSQAVKVGRNDPCPCGAVNPQTGKRYKYKHCGLINAPYHKN